MSTALGSVADIVTALTAIGALVAAIVAARHARTLLDAERIRDDKTDARERRAQASKVFAWVAARIPTESENPSAYGAVVVNSSEQAIFDVTVTVCGHDGAERMPITLTLLPPGSYYLEESRENYGWEFARALASLEDEIRPITKSRLRRIARLRFEDSTNLFWQRDDHGTLIELEVAGSGR